MTSAKVLCFLGHAEVVRVLLEANANVEDHNENGHTPLMEAASAGHVEVAKILLEYGAGINTHSNEANFYFVFFYTVNDLLPKPSA